MILLALAGHLAAAALAEPALPPSAPRQPQATQVERLEVSASPRECARDPKCWGLVRMMFLKNFGLLRYQVDGAPSNTFFPGTTTFSLRAAVKGSGHFLHVLCNLPGGKRRRCDDQRDELEKRVFEAAVVLSLPGGGAPQDMMNQDTLVLTPEGEKVLLDAKAARPSLVEELLGAAIQAMGVEDDPVPKALR